MAKKSHVAPHFDCLDLMNAMVLLKHSWCHVMLMLLPVVSHDKNSHVEPSFNHLHVMNAVMPIMIPSASCYADTHANDVTSQKIMFHLDLKRFSIAIINAICIKWPKWHHMTEQSCCNLPLRTQESHF